jgi:uncharacterized protein YqjF (DUF2071 family)
MLAQRWDNLLLAHWRAEPRALRCLLPAQVEPDLYDGTGWVSVVAFVMTGTRPFAVAHAPCLPPVPELNVRTYVRMGDARGVWFLSLDASSLLFVTIGRALYGLRYRLAAMTAAADGDRVHYLSTRSGAAFSASYEPTGPGALAPAGSLEHFLVERYRLFAERRGRLIAAQVAHEPWQLQQAEARIELNRMAPPGLAFDGPPLLHFSRSLEALISTPEPVHRERVSRSQARHHAIRAPRPARTPSAPRP